MELTTRVEYLLLYNLASSMCVSVW